MKKFYWPIVAVVFIVAVGLIIYVAYMPDKEAVVGEFSKEPPVDQNEAVLTVDFGDKKRTFIGEVVDGMTILDALEASVNGDTVGGLYYKLDENSKKLAAIDGFENNGKEWSIYKNGVKEERSLDEIVLEVQDEIELKLE